MNEAEDIGEGGSMADSWPKMIHGYEEQKWHGAGGGLAPDWDI